MKRSLLISFLVAAMVWSAPVLAVLRQAALTVTEQGQPIPGATIMLTRPRPHGATAATSHAAPRPAGLSGGAQQSPAPQQTAQPYPADYVYDPCPPGFDYAAGQNPPCYPRPLEATWISGTTDAYGRLALQFDDRYATPGAVVDMTVYYPNGEIRRMFDIPVTALYAGAIDLAALPSVAAAPPPSYAPPVYAPPPNAAPLGNLPNIMTGIGVGLAIGGMHGGYSRHER